MDFLGIGPLELLVILVIALIVVGPERLPEIASSIGKFVRQARAISSGLTTEWQRELSAATQDLQQGEDLTKAILDPLSEASAGVQKLLDTSIDVSPSSLSASTTSPPSESAIEPASASGAASESSAPAAPLEKSEPEEVVEDTVDVQPKLEPERSDLPDIVEEDTHAD